MKMNFKPFLTVAMTMWALTVPALSVTAADDNTLAIVDFTAQAGSTIDMPVCMNNKASIFSFQCDLVLPEGVSIVYDEEEEDYAINLSTTRTTLKKHSLSFAYQKDGSMRVTCSSAKNESFGGESGEVLKVKLALAKDLEEGEYAIILKNMELAEANMTKYNPADVTATMTVGEVAPTYDEGYGLQINPFEITPGQSYDEEEEDNNLVIDVNMDNLESIFSLSYQLELPEGVSVATDSEDEFVLGYGNRRNSTNSKFAPNIEQDGNIYTIEYTYTGTNSSTAAKCFFKETTGTVMTIPLVASPTLADGVYTLKISNIVMIDGEDNEYSNIAPYATNIFVGSTPKATPENGTVTFGGDFSDADMAAKLIAAIPADDASVTTVDLTGVTALPTGKTITTANPNTLIKTSSDLGLTNTQNVVVDGVCANLVLTDGQPFENTKAFTATSATYSRTMPAKYGTIYLPFAPDTEDYAFFQLADMDGNTLTFEEVTTPQANTPYLYRAKKSSTGAITASSAKIPAAKNATNAVYEQLTMKGTYTTKVFQLGSMPAEGDIFFIYDNTFYRFACTTASDVLTIAPFRAYFEGAVGTASLAIRERNGETTSIDALEVEGCGQWYDLLGRPVENPTRGIYLLNGKKVIVK